MIVHHRLFAERLALIAREMKTQLGAVTLFVFGELAFEVFQKRLEPMRAYAIGAARHFHLEQTQIETHLKFWRAIRAADLTDVDRPGLIIPTPQKRGDVLARRFSFRV